MSTGNEFEEPLLRLAEKKLGKLTLNQFRVLQGTKLGTNCDAIVNETGKPVEAKLRSRDDKWGQTDTDEVPDEIILQCTAQMLCTGTDLCHVAAMLATRGFKLQMFYVPLDKNIADLVANAAVDFWERYVKTETPPPNVLPSKDTVKRMIRVPNKIVKVDSTLLATREYYRGIKTGAEKMFEEADLKLKAALGDAESGICDNGYEITYFEQHRKEKITPAKTFRVLKIKEK
jgi:predicted phage-related endonuclease